MDRRSGSNSSSPEYTPNYITIIKNGRTYECYSRQTFPPNGMKTKGHIVLLHGIVSSSASMLGLMEYLSSKGYECFAPDLLAHGFTTVDEINPTDYKVAYVAEIVHEMVEYIGYTGYFLLGHSAGGIVAQVYADMYPSEVDKLILSSTSCKLLKTPSWNYGLSKEALIAFQSIASSSMSSSNIGKFGMDILSEPCDSSKLDIIKKSSAIIAGQANKEGISLFIQQNLNIDLREVLIKMNKPVMVLIGDRDALFSVGEAEWIRDNVANGYLHIFKGKNHAPFLTDYIRYNRVVYDYITGELDKCDIFTAIPIPDIAMPTSKPKTKVRPPLVV